MSEKLQIRWEFRIIGRFGTFHSLVQPLTTKQNNNNNTISVAVVEYFYVLFFASYCPRDKSCLLWFLEAGLASYKARLENFSSFVSGEQFRLQGTPGLTSPASERQAMATSERLSSEQRAADEINSIQTVTHDYHDVWRVSEERGRGGWT